MIEKRRKARIAVAQIRYSLDSEKNVRKIKEYIRLSKKRGAEIVCFPEACLHQSKQFEIGHRFIKEIREECKKNSIWAIINDDLKIGKKYYSAALLIDRNGKIKGIYRKINTFDEDVEAGRKIGVFKTDFAKIGIAICWDLKFPELFRKMKLAGAEIIFCPTRWCYEFEVYNSGHKERERKLLKSIIRTRAFENMNFVAVANPVIAGAYFRDLVSYSAIVSPHKVLRQIKNKEGLIIADINFNEIKKLHKIYQIKKI